MLFYDFQYVRGKILSCLNKWENKFLIVVFNLVSFVLMKEKIGGIFNKVFN